MAFVGSAIAVGTFVGVGGAGVAAGMVGGAIIGGGIGAAVGESMNAGGWKNGLMYGAAAGAAGGGIGAWATGAGAAQGTAAVGAAEGATAAQGGTMTAAQQMGASQAGYSSYVGGAATKGIATAATPLSTTVAGKGLGLAMLAGQVGMGLLSGTSSGGSPSMEEFHLSGPGQDLMNSYERRANATMKRRKKGDVRDISTEAIHKLKMQEGGRNRSFTSATSLLASKMGNTPRIERGGQAAGGQTVKMLGAGQSERVSGLYAPYATRSNFQKEGLWNAMKHLNNITSLKNNAAMFSYGGQLANYNAEQQLQSDRGAAYGQAVASVGNYAMNTAYYNRIAAT